MAALDEMRAALELEPEQTEMRRFTARLLVLASRFGEAIETLREVLHFYSKRENIPRTHGEQGVIRRLDLTESELDDLEAFLHSLNGRPLPSHLLLAPASPG